MEGVSCGFPGLGGCALLEAPGYGERVGGCGFLEEGDEGLVFGSEVLVPVGEEGGEGGGCEETAGVFVAPDAGAAVDRVLPFLHGTSGLQEVDVVYL